MRKYLFVTLWLLSSSVLSVSYAKESAHPNNTELNTPTSPSHETSSEENKKHRSTHLSYARSMDAQ